MYSLENLFLFMRSLQCIHRLFHYMIQYYQQIVRPKLRQQHMLNEKQVIQ